MPDVHPWFRSACVVLCCVVRCDGLGFIVLGLAWWWGGVEVWRCGGVSEWHVGVFFLSCWRRCGRYVLFEDGGDGNR